MTNLAKLREPFPANQISYLPKGGIKLAYVGHAALTDRLLDTDPAWAWEPLALDARGLPAIDECGGLWIKLTVCGMTRMGYGDAGEKKGANAMKERIGDALRNAAMRFGAALELWHKGELHADDPAPPAAPLTRKVLSSPDPNTGDVSWVNDEPHIKGSLVPVLEASIAAVKAQRTGVMADVLANMLPLSPDDAMYFDELAANVEELFVSKGGSVALDRINAEGLDTAQKIHLNGRLGSKVRSALKAESAARVPA